MLRPGVSVLAAYHATSSELTRLTRSYSRKLLDGLVLEFADFHARWFPGQFPEFTCYELRAGFEVSPTAPRSHRGSDSFAIFRVPRLFSRAVANYKHVRESPSFPRVKHRVCKSQG